MMSLTTEDLQAIAGLIQTAIQPLRDDMQIMKDDIRILKHDVQILKEEMQTLKSDVQTLKEEVQTLKSDVQTLKEEVQTLKGEVQTLKSDVQTLNEKSDELNRRTTAIELLLENETNHNIQLLAENHINLVNKLNDAIKVQDKSILYEVQVSGLKYRIDILERTVAELKEQIA